MTTGTEGNDTLTNDPNVNPETIYALGGDDSISFLFGMTDTHLEIDVYGGTGYDTITMTASYGTANSIGDLYFDNSRAFIAMSVDYFEIEKIVLTLNSAGNLYTGDTEDYFDIATTAGIISTGGGNDTIYVDSDYYGFTASGGAGDDIIVGGNADFMDNYPGNYADTLNGDAGNDRLDGGNGDDVMTGGTGHDAYWIGDAGDQVIEAAGEGTDKVFSTLFRTELGANVENLALLGSAVSGYGNALNNIITGNAEANALYGFAGDDRLDGGAGADRLSGGDGDDTYFIDAAGDVAVEASATGGTDTVYSAVSYNLAYQHIERLFLTGTAAINATGNSLDNTLVGNSGANVLDGGLGADVMNGGNGNDTYIVDNAGDVVIDGYAGGTNDIVMSSVTFFISDSYHIETLILTGTAAINGYGNYRANRIEGNDNNNILNGGTGADVMIGNGGNDTYYVDDAYDSVREVAGEGIDSVYTSINYDADGRDVENIYLTGTANLVAWGNSLANRLYGNSGDNRLDGRGGADFMSGGDGDDVYYVDNEGDRVVEQADGGNDVINSRVSFNLAGIHVETLIVRGEGVVTGTGNSLANTIDLWGAAGSALRGLGGDDLLDGGSAGLHFYGGTGNDILESYYSNTDRFFFDTALNASTNVDTIRGFDAVGYDQFQLSRAIFAAIDAGVLSEDAFHEGSAAADAEDRIVYNVQTGEVFYDADGNGAGAAILFARLDPGVQLEYYHFFAY